MCYIGAWQVDALWGGIARVRGSATGAHGSQDRPRTCLPQVSPILSHLLLVCLVFLWFFLTR